MADTPIDRDASRPPEGEIVIATLTRNAGISWEEGKETSD